MKNPSRPFSTIWQYYIETWRYRIAGTLTKRNKVRGNTLLDFKFYYWVIAIKTLCVHIIEYVCSSSSSHKNFDKGTEAV